MVNVWCIDEFRTEQHSGPKDLDEQRVGDMKGDSMLSGRPEVMWLELRLCGLMQWEMTSSGNINSIQLPISSLWELYIVSYPWDYVKRAQ